MLEHTALDMGMLLLSFVGGVAVGVVLIVFALCVVSVKQEEEKEYREEM